MSSSDTVSVLSLFHYAPATVLLDRQMKFKVLTFLDFFLENMLESIQLFCVEKRYDQFDPHVGETLCQIRSCQILWLAQDYRVKYELEKRSSEVFRIKANLSIIKEMFEQSIQKYSKSLHYSLNQPQILENFLQQYHLNFSTLPELIYLTRCRILTKFSKVHFNHIGRIAEIDYQGFTERLPFGSDAIRKLVRHLQNSLASYSCYSVIQWALELQNIPVSKELLGRLQRKDFLGRLVLPGLEVTQVILAHMLKNNCSIVFIIKRYSEIEIDTLYLHFVPNELKTDYILEKYSELQDVYTPCFVLEGQTRYIGKHSESSEEFIERFLQVGCIAVILQNVAAHPSYSAAEFDYLENDPYQDIRQQDAQGLSVEVDDQRNYFKAMRTAAFYHGCCNQNPTLFLIKHIFCASLRHCLPKTTLAQAEYMIKVLPNMTSVKLPRHYIASQ